MPFAAIWVDLDIIILSELSHKKTKTIWYHKWNLTYDTNESVYETESQA